MMNAEDLGKVDGKLIKWTVGSVLALVTSFGTIWVQKIESELTRKEQQLAVTQERVATVESNVKSLETSVRIMNDVVNSRLSRIEDKLDYLIGYKTQQGVGK